jgi:Ca2+-transporting ATPase
MPYDSNEVPFESLFEGLTWLGLVGIRDPVRQAVPAAIQDCRRAHVRVIMITGDNRDTATAIATDCGILNPRDDQEIVTDGAQLHALSDDELDKILPNLRVLARSSPEDKRRVVLGLQKNGDVVAVTGDGTNDALALKAADIGFAMGITGTEIAKEASDIILMTDDFSSIVHALLWGRAINDAVRRFLQFQITVNITAVAIVFITACTARAFKNSGEGSVLTAVQLLWVNLIMDTLAALALATDPPTRDLLEKKPESRNRPLITRAMWKMIISQSILQLAVTLPIYYLATLNKLPWARGWEAQMPTFIFNMFVWFQIFGMVNCRSIDSTKNIFRGVQHNLIFIVVFSIIMGIQVLIVFVGGAALQVVDLNGPQWGISIALGALSLPMGLLVRLLPDWARRKQMDLERGEGKGR